MPISAQGGAMDLPTKKQQLEVVRMGLGFYNETKVAKSKGLQSFSYLGVLFADFLRISFLIIFRNSLSETLGL